MAAAVDPTYPLYPIACFLSAVMLLLVLLTNFIRQSWNFGVASLCFWLFLENLVIGINTIIWADNADIKFDVYCDIGADTSFRCISGREFSLEFHTAVSHLQMFTYVVKPMATLIITRRLYLITSLQSVELPSKEAVRSTIYSSLPRRN